MPAAARSIQYATDTVGFRARIPARWRRRTHERGGEQSNSAEPGRTLHHLGFARNVRQEAPPGFEVQVEVPLSLDSRRIDLLLLRLRGRRRDHEAGILRQLWPLLGEQTLLDFKGPTRGFRSGELLRLDSYGSEYLATRCHEFQDPSQLTLVLVVPRMAPALAREITWLNLRVEPIADGYARLAGSRYTMIVVLLDRVSHREKILRPFTHARRLDKEVAHRTLAWLLEVVQMEDIEKLEGLDDLLDKLAATLGPEIVLRHFAPEQRLAGLDLEQRLAGLDPESLADLQKAIRKKLNRSR